MKERIKSIRDNVSWISIFCLSITISSCIQCLTLEDIKKELKEVNERMSLQRKVEP